VDNNNFSRDGRIPFRNGFISHLMTACTGAVIGGLLVLAFAPAALMGAQPKENRMQEETPVFVQQGYIPVAAAAKKVMPAVVGIRTTEFKMDMIYGTREPEGIGSGIIVDSSGYIVTNNHVADDRTDEIIVSLMDGRSFKGRIVWTDEGLDLSVLKINADGLTAAELGDSSKLIAGEQAIAIGNPLGLRFERSVTSGIISALNRTIPMEGGQFMEDLIQTDASINSGNSGGPLLNSEGKVIGINTIKVSSAEGMGFAIPVNIIIPVVKSIVEEGGFKTPSIGVTGLDREIAAFYGYELDEGIYISSIDWKGPAFEAGLRKGNIIMKVSGVPVNTLTTLKQQLFSAGAGSSVTVEYKDKNGAIKTSSIKLGVVPDR
jgi:S1-C subfamily serine protease